MADNIIFENTIEESRLVSYDINNLNEEFSNIVIQENKHDELKFPENMVTYPSFYEFYKTQKIEENTYIPIDNVKEFSRIVIPDTWSFISQDPDLVADLKQIFTKLKEFKAQGFTIYPNENNIFKAFELCPYNNIKVVILGQDPYETIDPDLGIERANGLAFSTWKEAKIPNSLTNIFKELRRTYNGIQLQHPDLSSWASQGVLLLNTALTVNRDNAGSHEKTGMYKHFIGRIISKISEIPGVVFCLWGRKAENYESFINKKCLILKCGHPSGRNFGEYKFEENGHFAAIYYHLEKLGKQQINWTLIK